MLNEIFFILSLFFISKNLKNSNQNYRNQKEKLYNLISKYYKNNKNKIKNFELEKSNINILENGNIEIKTYHLNFMYSFIGLNLKNDGKDFPILIDTGSLELFIDSINCNTCNPKVLKWNCNEKYGSKITNNRIRLGYCIGIVFGKLGYLDIFLYNKIIKDYKFLLADNVIGYQINFVLSGILGFGLKVYLKDQILFNL